MKNFKRFIAFVLCAVMLAGLVPMAFDAKVVAADTDVDAVVQGPEDAVIIYDNTAVDFRTVFGAFVGNKVLVNSGEECGVGGTTSGAAYDRIILVVAVDTKMATGSTAFEHAKVAFTDTENIVITSKCYAEYTDNVYMYSGSTYDSLVKMNTALASGKTNPFTDNLIDKTDVSFTFVDKTITDARYIRIASDLGFEYITLNFSAHNVLYLSGYDFYISDTVKFTHTYGTTTGYNPVIVNGSNTDASFDMGDNTQTVTLSAGTYQYVSLRTRDNYRAYANMDITLNLGDISIVSQNGANQTAFLANDIYNNVKMTVNIDGTTFKYPVYLLGGTQTTASYAPSVTATELNVNIKDGTFEQGIFAYFSVADGSKKEYTVNSLTVNLDIDNCELGTDCTIEGEFDTFAANTTSTVTYPDGALFSSAIKKFDVYKTKTVDFCTEGHTYISTVVDDVCCYACKFCSTVDETKTVSFDAETGSPIIYVDYNGSNSNDGLTEETPVKNPWKACEILSGWQQGGCIVVLGDAVKFDTHTKDANSVDCTMLVDIGGTLYIDGNYGGAKGEDARATLTSNSGYVYFENDTVFRNIALFSTNNHKVWILNYNSFCATENCAQTNPSNYNITLYAGALNNTSGAIAKYATDKVIDQDILIDGFCFQSIMTGSKSLQKNSAVTDDNPEGTPCVRYSREYSVRCSGLTTLYIGANSKVDSINVRKNHYNSTSGLVENITAPDVRIHIDSAAIPEAGIEFVQNTTHLSATRVYSTEGDNKNMFADDRALILYGDDFSDIATVLTVYDANVFEHVSAGYKQDAEAVRVTFAEVNDSLQAENVAEFGVLFTVPEYTDDVHYVYATGDQGLVAKSLCYDKANAVNNYLYDGVNAAYFHGVIKLDNPALSDITFAATPYAVVDVAAADGVTGSVAAQYCVIGEGYTTSFADIVAAAN